MYVITKFEIPVSEYEFIKEGTKLEIIKSWNEYTGFIAVKYRNGELYFPIGYFEEIPALVEVV